jgi:hypothetical protein
VGLGVRPQIAARRSLEARIGGLKGPPLLFTREAQAGSRAEGRKGEDYLPLVSTFAFSSSFIFFTVGSRLASPVVWVVVAGGGLLGMELCSAGLFAGRVAVAGGGFVCALAACAFKRRAPDNSDTASAVWLGFIDPSPVQINETVCTI